MMHVSSTSSLLNGSSSVLNPVGALQERFQSRGIVPNYAEMESTDGLFAIRVTVLNEVAVGKAGSKKGAKASAASNMMELLDAKCKPSSSTLSSKSSSLDSPLSSPSPSPSSSSSSLQSPAMISLSKSSPISKLHELCTKQKLPQPSFEEIKQSGESHQPCFRVRVIVNEIMCEAEGRSKKEAKTTACSNMLKLIEKKQDDENKKNVVTSSCEVNGNNKNEKSNNTENDSNSVSVMEPPSMESLEQCLSQRIRLSPKLVQCLEVALCERFEDERNDSGPSTFLEALCKELSLNIIYRDVVGKKGNGNQMVMVQVQSNPALVFFGNGKDELLAKKDAALNALHYFKTISHAERVEE